MGLQPFPAPASWKVGWFPNEMAIVPQLQMRGLETSMAQRKGRDPDNSLRKLSIRLYTDITLRTVSQCQCQRDPLHVLLRTSPSWTVMMRVKTYERHP